MSQWLTELKETSEHSPTASLLLRSTPAGAAPASLLSASPPLTFSCQTSLLYYSYPDDSETTVDPPVLTKPALTRITNLFLTLPVLKLSSMQLLRTSQTPVLLIQMFFSYSHNHILIFKNESNLNCGQLFLFSTLKTVTITLELTWMAHQLNLKWLCASVFIFS